jgi:hypothetical protein
MKTIWKIIIGIPSAAAVITIIGGLYLYFDSIRNKPVPEAKIIEIVKTQVTEIVKTQIDPLNDQMLFQWDALTTISSNQELLKKSVYSLIRKNNQDNIPEKIDKVYNFLNEWKTTELKKK